MSCQPSSARIQVHKFIRAATFLILLTAAVAFPAAPAQATTVAGRTTGSFAVSPTGAATYSIPIWAPPGPHGMQPSIALSYNSHQGNGIVGVGWSVSGLSSIYRCNLTYAQDAAPAPVSLATSDGYCMDGQRLRLTSGTYGTAGSTYQTEVANFINVTAYSSAGNGPGYWVAQDRNGKTYTYGNGGSSQVLATGSTTASAWMLNEVSDQPGNTMTLSYSTATGSAVPTVISWTPSSHGSSNYNYTMTFAYGTNVPQSSLYAYSAGTAVTNTNLLSSITIAYSGTTVKKYVLTYQASPTTGRYELEQVQECSDSGGTNCLLPTVITYQSGAAGVSTSATSMPAGGYVLYDFNGDGYADLLYANGSTYYVAFGSASGFGTPVNTMISTSVAQIFPGDFLGAGEDGLLVATGGAWYYYTWNANSKSFTGTPTGLTYDSTAAQYVVADVNGDGLPDLVAAYFSQVNNGGITTSTYTINVLPNTGNGSSVTFGSAIQAYQVITPVLLSQPRLASSSWNTSSTPTFGNLRRFDFDGDGRDDLSMETITKNNPNCGASCTYTANTIELISQGTTFTAYTIASVASASYVPVTYLNFNSDACTDYFFGGVIYISGCNGSAPTSISLGSANVLGAMDWDGDGRTDILVQNGSTIGVYLSTGSGLSSLVSTSIPYNSGYTYFTLPDPNGDGQDAIGYGTGSAAYYYPHNSAGTPPDLATSFTDGYGNSASPTYVSLVQSNYTQSTNATYPEENYVGPMYVVALATFSDPSSATSGTYNQSFEYYKAWTNLQGRGFDGFVDISSYDSRNGLQDDKYFERRFPYTGIQYGETTTIGTVEPTEWVNTLSAVTLSSTQYQQRYFPYVVSTSARSMEVGGTENGDLSTGVAINYVFDNYGNATSITKTVTDIDPNSPYNGQSWTTITTNTPDVDTTHWCLGLFTETQIAYSSTLVGSGSVTRTKTMTPDTTNCRYNQIVTEPSSTQFKVTETLGYDSFGNVNSDTVTGVGMTSRVTTANWGTTGQFPMSVTDPTNAITQYNYNFSYGLKSSVTDPNNETTSWQYGDGFGRLTQETRPNLTYTTYSYQNCSGTTGCLIGPNGLVIAHTNYGKNGSVLSSGTDFKDPVDRALVSNQVMLSGSFSRNEVRYDSLGRVSQKAFPCTWSALATACPYWTTNSYDVLNRLTQSQRPISSTNSNPQTTTYAYAGRTTTVTDPQLNARTAVTDVNGWLRQTGDPTGYVVTLDYDAAGAKTKVTDSLGNTLWSGTYNYGLSAYLASATDMDMGSWGFTVDALGEKTAWSDAKAQSFSETYDALSRPLTRTEPDLFTQWTWGSSPSSHNVGKLQSVCTGTGSSCTSSGYAESETYDSLARLSQRTITLPGYSPFTYTWGYATSSGYLNYLQYPPGSLSLTYQYSNGFLQSATADTAPNTIVWQANTMDPAGHVTEETLGNGIVTNRSYDAVTQWLGTAQSGVGGGAGVKNLAFLYDEMGNVTQRQDNNLGLTENIYYDNDYRFSYSKLNGTQNLSVTYDFTGDITSRTDLAGGASWTYDPNHKHEVTQAGSGAYQYSYDANGNAITRQGSTIGWTSYNYPSTINAGSGSTAETVAFSYGPDRRRWQQTYTGNGTQETTDYVGGLLEVVASGGLTDYRYYINVGGENVAVYSIKSNGTNTLSYLLSDHQSSVASITNSSGAQVVGESFDAFGTRRNPATWSGPDSNSDLTAIAGITREGYTFQTALGLWMGMNHMNGRVEDSITGRMLSADPHIPNPANPQTYNRYSYVNNNPITYGDPSGFTPCGKNCRPVNPMCAVVWVQCGEVGGLGTGAYAWQSFQSYLNNPDQDFNQSASNLLNNLQAGATLSLPGFDSASAPTTSAGSDAKVTVDLTPPIMSTGNSDEIGEVTVCASCKVTIDVPMPALPPSLQNPFPKDQLERAALGFAAAEAGSGPMVVGLGPNTARIYPWGWTGGSKGLIYAFKLAPVFNFLGGMATGGAALYEGYQMANGDKPLGEGLLDIGVNGSAWLMGGPEGFVMSVGYISLKDPATAAAAAEACSVPMVCN